MSDNNHYDIMISDTLIDSQYGDKIDKDGVCLMTILAICRDQLE